MIDEDNPEEIPDGDETVDPEYFPPDFDESQLPDGWNYWTWDDFWLWIDENYEVPDISGISPSGALNGG